MVGGISGPGVRAPVVIVVGVVRTLQAARLIAPISGRVARALPGRAAFTWRLLAADMVPHLRSAPTAPCRSRSPFITILAEVRHIDSDGKVQAAPARWPRLSTPPTADFLRVLLGLGRGGRHRPARENRLEADRGRLKGQAAADAWTDTPPVRGGSRGGPPGGCRSRRRRGAGWGHLGPAPGTSASYIGSADPHRLVIDKPPPAPSPMHPHRSAAPAIS